MIMVGDQKKCSRFKIPVHTNTRKHNTSPVFFNIETITCFKKNHHFANIVQSKTINFSKIFLPMSYSCQSYFYNLLVLLDSLNLSLGECHGNIYEMSSINLVHDNHVQRGSHREFRLVLSSKKLRLF